MSTDAPDEMPAQASDEGTNITRTVYEFAYGIDTRDWDLYRSIFADEVDFDYTSYHGQPATRMFADDWVKSVRRLFDGLDATQHSMTNPLVDIDPDGTTARCRVYMQAAHFLHRDDLLERTGSADAEFTIGGFYDDRLARTAAGWRITAVTLTVLWRRGNEAIMPLAHEIAAGRA